MNINLDEIEHDQAIIILQRIVDEHPSIISSIQRIMRQLDSQANSTHIAVEIFTTLDLIDVEDLWRNSGPTRYGYVDPGDLAFEMVEEAIEPYVHKFRNYLSNSRWEKAKIVCMAILQGLHEFETKSNSEFKDWAPDVTDTLQSNLLDELNKRCNDQSLLEEVNKFFESLR